MGRKGTAAFGRGTRGPATPGIGGGEGISGGSIISSIIRGSISGGVGISGGGIIRWNNEI